MCCCIDHTLLRLCFKNNGWEPCITRHRALNLFALGEGSGLQSLEYREKLKISIPDEVCGGIISRIFSEISAM